MFRNTADFFLFCSHLDWIARLHCRLWPHQCCPGRVGTPRSGRATLAGSKAGGSGCPLLIFLLFLLLLEELPVSTSTLDGSLGPRWPQGLSIPRALMGWKGNKSAEGVYGGWWCWWWWWWAYQPLPIGGLVGLRLLAHGLGGLGEDTSSTVHAASLTAASPPGRFLGGGSTFSTSFLSTLPSGWVAKSYQRLSSSSSIGWPFEAFEAGKVLCGGLTADPAVSSKLRELLSVSHDSSNRHHSLTLILPQNTVSQCYSAFKFSSSKFYVRKGSSDKLYTQHNIKIKVNVWKHVDSIELEYLSSVNLGFSLTPFVTL